MLSPVRAYWYTPATHPPVVAGVSLQLPAAVDFLVQWQHPPADLDATPEPAAQQVVQQYEQLITHLTEAAGSSKATTTSSGSSSKKLLGQQPWQTPSTQRQLQQGYKCAAGYLQKRLGALLQLGGVHVEEASRMGAQLLQLLQRCHSAGAADEEVYTQWAEAADQLHQHKVRGMLMLSCVLLQSMIAAPAHCLQWARCGLLSSPRLQLQTQQRTVRHSLCICNVCLHALL
jgi:hypothetical protein